MHEEQEGVIPGNALVVDPKKQFRPLSKFGNAFLNRFQCSNTTSEVLKGNYEFNRLWNYHHNSYLYGEERYFVYSSFSNRYINRGHAGNT